MFKKCKKMITSKRIGLSVFGAVSILRIIYYGRGQKWQEKEDAGGLHLDDHDMSREKCQDTDKFMT